MSQCESRAVLIVTTRPEGTATNVARRRAELVCGLPVDHEGPHRDAENAETWESVRGATAMVFRHEDDD